MDLNQTCRWLREQSFPTDLGKLKQNLLLAAGRVSSDGLSEEAAQTLFATLDQALQTFKETNEFRLSGDLSIPALTQVSLVKNQPQEAKE